MTDHEVKRVYRDLKTGDSLRFIKTDEETQGKLLEVEICYTARHRRPAPHYHPYQHEYFHVRTGAIAVDMNGTTQTYTEGESFDVPAGVVHTMWNAGSTDVVMRWQISPAMKTQQLFETIWSLGEDEKLGENMTPNLLQAAVLMQTYKDEFRLANPPRIVQVILFGILGPIGRLLRYPSYYISSR